MRLKNGSIFRGSSSLVTLHPAVFRGRPIPEAAVGEVPNESWPSKNKQPKKVFGHQKMPKRLLSQTTKPRDFWFDFSTVNSGWSNPGFTTRRHCATFEVATSWESRSMDV